MRLELTTAPASEPVTLTEAKAQCRVELSFADDDALLTRAIQSAREEAEGMTGRVFITQTWTLKMDRFPASQEVRISKLPLISVTHIKYVDENGDLQTLAAADYVVDKSGVVPRIYLAYEKSWPVTRDEPNAIRIEFIAGYGAQAAVPGMFKSWMLLRIGERYAHREGVVVGAIPSRVPNVDTLVLSERVGF